MKKHILELTTAVAVVMVGAFWWKKAQTVTNSRSSLEPVSLVLNWTANGTHAAFYAALMEGFYSEEGLQVDIKQGSGSMTAVKVIGAGQQEFALANAESVVIGRSKGIPVVSLAAFYQRTPACLISLASAGIKTPKDLEGKTMGVKFESFTYPLYEAILRQHGVDRSKVHELSIGSGVEPLLQGQIDAMDGQIDNEPVQASERGFPVETISYFDLGVRSYGVCLVTSSTLLTQRRSVVAAFVRASLRGWDYTLRNPDAAAQCVVRANPALDPRIVLAQTRASLRLLVSDETRKEGIGWQNSAGWQQTIETLVRAGQVDKPPTPAELFTSDFVAEQTRVIPAQTQAGGG